MKPDFVSCKKWLRRNFPLKYPLRILRVQHKTIVDNDGGTYEAEYDGYYILHKDNTHKILLDKELKEKKLIETLLHEYAHAIQADNGGMNGAPHDDEFQNIHKKILRKWAAKCT